MPKLEHILTFRADLRDPVDVGAGPIGARQIFDVSGGSFEGPRLKGSVLPSGADWILMGSDGVGRLDVRATLQTHDGANIYVQYFGVVHLNEKVMAALASGQETEFGDTYFFTAPRFETGDERYAWLNGIVTVGQGRMLPNAVEYRAFEVQND
jgi:hypothetical protein